MLGVQVIEIVNPEGDECSFCFGEIYFYEYAAEVENDVFYFLH